MNLGLRVFADAIANLAYHAAKGKKGQRETVRRIAVDALPIINEAYFAGMDAALIAVREHPGAVLAIEAHKREISREAGK